MAQKQLTELTITELKAKEKNLAAGIAIMGGVIVVMIFASIYLTIKKGFNTFTALPVVFFGVVAINVKNLKEIKKELASRSV